MPSPRKPPMTRTRPSGNVVAVWKPRASPSRPMRPNETLTGSQTSADASSVSSGPKPPDDEDTTVGDEWAGVRPARFPERTCRSECPGLRLPRLGRGQHASDTDATDAEDAAIGQDRGGHGRCDLLPASRPGGTRLRAGLALRQRRYQPCLDCDQDRDRDDGAGLRRSSAYVLQHPGIPHRAERGGSATGSARSRQPTSSGRTSSPPASAHDGRERGRAQEPEVTTSGSVGMAGTAQVGTPGVPRPIRASCRRARRRL